MKRNAFGRMALVAGCSMTIAAGTIGVGSATAEAATSTAPAASVVPPPGAPTAYGYTAFIRHPSAWNDGRGTLVLQAPSGAHTTVGPVSDNATVLDVSTNARTVLTGFYVNTGEQMRLTMWDTESRKPTYVRVANGSRAVLVKDGLYVTRYGQSPQLYSRSGALLKTYSGVAGGEVAASADGTKVVQSGTSNRVFVRTVSTGAVTRVVPLPAGSQACGPGHQYGASEFTMDCGAGQPGTRQVYRFGLTGTAAPVLTISNNKQAQDARKVDVGQVFDAATESICPQPTLATGGAFKGLKAGGETNLGVAGAYGDTAYLWSDGVDCTSSSGLYRYTISTGAATKVAGSGTASDGVITQAVTVDGT